MSTRYRGRRSTEAPMDFQFTSRPSSHIKPVWAQPQEDSCTPRKRSHNDINPPPPAFPSTTHTPTFGTNQDVPFIFQAPPPQTTYKHPWTPPPNFSPSNAFPQPSSEVDVNDVDMKEVSPPKPEREADGGRAVSLGGMRRVFKSRQKSRERSHLRPAKVSEEEDDNYAEGESEHSRRLLQNTSNHYTLNLPSAPAPQSDTPYILLGYLQFFFNLCLILLFLYLVLQFILTVQRDVEQRISEYSMDIVQEIALCTLQHKNNLCSNPIPAMAQQCASWETCMSRDPTIVGRAKVGAELIAEVVNGFVEPISWKTLAFTLTSLSFLTVFINALLSLYRTRYHPASPPAERHQPSFHNIPAGSYPPFMGSGYIPPGASPGWGHSWHGEDDEDQPTAARRRRLEGGGAAKIT